jgi:hypothetical protein
MEHEAFPMEHEAFPMEHEALDPIVDIRTDAAYTERMYILFMV